MLFMGVALNHFLEKKLDNPQGDLFILKEKLLIKTIFNEQCFLGKPLTVGQSLEELKDIQKHIISLISRLAPGYPITTQDIKIFAYDGKLDHC